MRVMAAAGAPARRAPSPQRGGAGHGGRRVRPRRTQAITGVARERGRRGQAPEQADAHADAHAAQIEALERALAMSQYAAHAVPSRERAAARAERWHVEHMPELEGHAADLGAEGSGAVADARGDDASRTVLGFEVDAHLQGVLMLNLLTILFGSNMALLKMSEGVGGMEPELFTAVRFATAAAALAPLGLTKALRDPQLALGGLELGFWAAGGYATQAMALLSADASRVSFLSAFTVISVPLLAGLTGKETPKCTWLCVALALGGVSLLEAGGSAPFGVGDAWALTSALLFGVHILRTEHYAHMFAKDPLPVIGLQMATVAAACTAWAAAQGVLPSDGEHLVDMMSGCMPEILYTGLISTALTLWLEIKAMKEVDATTAALTYAAEPMWGAAFAWVLLGERWGAAGWAGAALIITSSCLSSLLSDHHEDEPGREA